MIRNIFIGIILVMFTGEVAFAQQISEPAIVKELNEPVLKIQPANTNVKNPIALEQVILFKIVDEKGFEKEYVSKEERQTIEKNVREYEKSKKINDRSGTIYIVNHKLEVFSDEKIQK